MAESSRQASSSEERLRRLIKSRTLNNARRVSGSLQNELVEFLAEKPQLAVTESVLKQLADRAALQVVSSSASTRAAEYRRTLDRLGALYEEGFARVGRVGAPSRAGRPFVNIKMFRKATKKSELRVAPWCPAK